MAHNSASLASLRTFFTLSCVRALDDFYRCSTFLKAARRNAMYQLPGRYTQLKEGGYIIW